MFEVFIKDNELYLGLTKRDVITKVLPMGDIREEGKSALKDALLLFTNDNDEIRLKRSRLCDAVSKAILEDKASYDDHLWFYAFNLFEKYNSREVSYKVLSNCKVCSHDITFLYAEQTDDAEVVEYN